MLANVGRRLLGLLLCFALIAPGASVAQTTDKKNSTDWIWITVGVGGLIDLLTHHNHTREATPSPAPSPTPVSMRPEETPQPVVSATPRIYGHDENVPCKYRMGDGYMQPTQHIWQDDRIFPYPHIIDRFQADYPLYQDYYDLIADRPTLLAGVYQYKDSNGVVRTPDDRDGDGKGHIKMSFSTNCDEKNAEPVRLEFSFYLDGKQTWKAIYALNYKAPFFGYVRPNGETDQYQVEVPAEKGWPSGGIAFKPPGAGSYVLMAHIQRLHDRYWEDVPGLLMSVHGSVARTHGFTIHYIPMHLTSAARVALKDDTVGKAALRIAQDTGLKLPDLYPVVPSGGDSQAIFPWKVESDADGNVTDASGDEHITNPGKFVSSGIRDLFPPDYHFEPHSLSYENAMMEVLSNTYSLAAILEGGGRVVVVLNDHDFDLAGGAGAAAYTTSKKMIVAREGNQYTTIGHELAHTLPWDKVQKADVSDADSVGWMLSECQEGYHNVSAHAEGLHFIYDGKTPGYREIQDYKTGIMGPSSADRFIEQCTYRHLTDQLKGKTPDPQVFVIRGFIGRNATRMAGQFTSFYTTGSDVDDSRIDPTQDIRIDLRSASGALLKEVSYKPLFSRPDDYTKTMVTHPHFIAFFTRVPYVTGTREIDLVSRSRGVLARKIISAAPPVVRLSASAATVRDNGRIALQWSIASSARGPFYSSVFDSTDGGKTYVTKSIEQTGTGLSLRMIGRGSHVLRVVVSDGSQSGEATVNVLVTR